MASDRPSLKYADGVRLARNVRKNPRVFEQVLRDLFLHDSGRGVLQNQTFFGMLGKRPREDARRVWSSDSSSDRSDDEDDDDKSSDDEDDSVHKRARAESPRGEDVLRNDLTADVRHNVLYTLMLERARTDTAYARALFHLALVNTFYHDDVTAFMAAVRTRLDMDKILAEGVFLYFSDYQTRSMYLAQLHNYAPAVALAWEYLLGNYYSTARILFGEILPSLRKRERAMLIDAGRDPIATFLCCYHIAPDSVQVISAAALAELRAATDDIERLVLYEPRPAYVMSYTDANWTEAEYTRISDVWHFMRCKAIKWQVRPAPHAPIYVRTSAYEAFYHARHLCNDAVVREIAKLFAKDEEPDAYNFIETLLALTPVNARNHTYMRPILDAWFESVITAETPLDWFMELVEAAFDALDDEDPPEDISLDESALVLFASVALVCTRRHFGVEYAQQFLETWTDYFAPKLPGMNEALIDAFCEVAFTESIRRGDLAALTTAVTAVLPYVTAPAFEPFGRRLFITVQALCREQVARNDDEQGSFQLAAWQALDVLVAKFRHDPSAQEVVDKYDKIDEVAVTYMSALGPALRRALVARSSEPLSEDDMWFVDGATRRWAMARGHSFHEVFDALIATNPAEVIAQETQTLVLESCPDEAFVRDFLAYATRQGTNARTTNAVHATLSIWESTEAFPDYDTPSHVDDEFSPHAYWPTVNSTAFGVQQARATVDPMVLFTRAASFLIHAERPLVALRQLARWFGPDFEKAPAVLPPHPGAARAVSPSSDIGLNQPALNRLLLLSLEPDVGFVAFFFTHVRRIDSHLRFDGVECRYLYRNMIATVARLRSRERALAATRDSFRSLSGAPYQNDPEDYTWVGDSLTDDRADDNPFARYFPVCLALDRAHAQITALLEQTLPAEDTRVVWSDEDGGGGGEKEEAGEDSDGDAFRDVDFMGSVADSYAEGNAWYNPPDYDADGDVFPPPY